MQGESELAKRNQLVRVRRFAVGIRNLLVGVRAPTAHIDSLAVEILADVVALFADRFASVVEVGVGHES